MYQCIKKYIVICAYDWLLYNTPYFHQRLPTVRFLPVTNNKNNALSKTHTHTHNIYMRMFIYIEIDALALITTLSGRVGARANIFHLRALVTLSASRPGNQAAALALRACLCACSVRFVAVAVVRGAHACKRERAFTRANVHMPDCSHTMW